MQILQESVPVGKAATYMNSYHIGQSVPLLCLCLVVPPLHAHNRVLLFLIFYFLQKCVYSICFIENPKQHIDQNQVLLGCPSTVFALIGNSLNVSLAM